MRRPRYCASVQFDLFDEVGIRNAHSGLVGGGAIVLYLNVRKHGRERRGFGRDSVTSEKYDLNFSGGQLAACFSNHGFRGDVE